MVGQEDSVEMLIEGIRELPAGCSHEVALDSRGWKFGTRTQFVEAIHAAADFLDHLLAFTENEMNVLCAFACHQPINRASLKGAFKREMSRDLLARLRNNDLITGDLRVLRFGEPHTFLTTQTILAAFDLHGLRVLPDLELWDDL